MISKARLKLIRQLNQKKYRFHYGLFLIEGVKLVNELINSSLLIHSIYAVDTWIKENKELLSKREVKIIEISENELSRISQLSTPNKVLAIAHIPATINVQDENLILVLDHIQDPGNLGTIIRTADWFGLKTLVCSEGCVDAYNPKTVQASMGSLFRVQPFYVKLSEWLDKYREKKYRILAADIHGTPYYQIKPADKTLLILGNESHGLSQKIKLGAQTITIPGKGKAESLNVAVATGILLSYFTRS